MKLGYERMWVKERGIMGFGRDGFNQYKVMAI